MIRPLAPLRNDSPTAPLLGTAPLLSLSPHPERGQRTGSGDAKESQKKATRYLSGRHAGTGVWQGAGVLGVFLVIVIACLLVGVTPGQNALVTGLADVAVTVEV